MPFGAGLRALAFFAFAITTISGAEAVGATPAATLGPELPFAELAGPYVGQLAIEPERGPVGTPVKLTGSGLPGDQELDVVWRTSIGRWKVADAEYRGREYKPTGYRIAKVRTDREGRFSATFNAPEDFGFWHDIAVQQGTRLLTQGAFYTDMSVELASDRGPVGGPITVNVKGIGRQQLQNSWLLLYDNQFTGWISSVTTGGSASFTIPATGKPGRHVLEVLHGDFTFPYRNMQQSPESDRPRFVLPYTIAQGEPVLPPPPEKQIQAQVRSLPAEGELVATPRFAPIGTRTVVRGDGFKAGKTYTLNWTTVTGNRVSGSGWEESSRAIAEAAADASGKIEFSFDVPDDLGGAHGLWVEGSDVKKSGTFWTVPTARPLDVARGPAGTTFTVSLKGVGWTETANIYAITYDNSYIGYACGFNSQGSVEVYLQATGEPGWHFIDFYPAVYKGQESRPNNFRVPQLTYAQDHPGEDLPAFRFAFLVTPGAQVGELQQGLPR